MVKLYVREDAQVPRGTSKNSLSGFQSIIRLKPTTGYELGASLTWHLLRVLRHVPQL